MPVSLSKEELEVISLAEQFKGMQQSYAYQKLREIASAYVDEALKDMRGNLSSDDRLRSNLQLRWDVRRDFLEMLDTYLADIESQRKSILREIGQEAGMTPIQAFEFGETNA